MKRLLAINMKRLLATNIPAVAVMTLCVASVAAKADFSGTTPQAVAQDPWLPFVAYQGPHGYIIVVVGDKAHPHTEH
jgi:hypothetical protein